MLAQANALQPVVVRVLARRLVGWRPAQGVCPSCARRAAADHAAARSAFPLHERTEPHTTFPYYHPDEETVLGLPERLPDHGGFDGRGVTVAFLDSGYYPHPDLALDAPPAGLPPWERLSPAQLRRAVEEMGPRLADFVSLIGGRQARGLDLAELWGGHALAWHGQMTTAIAAGNGRLSSGRFRGYAPGATVLPISVGRGDGRIPESDILAGLEWLLHDHTAERLGVRVVNISIGGDFPQNWRENPVCRAAERLAERGVFVAAAAGNSARPELLAPAQTPSVLTVGGVDDRNLLLDFSRTDGVERVGLYHHNWGTVDGPRGPQRKPEVLAPAAWLPSPILPASPVFREMHAIARLRQSLRGDDGYGRGGEHADALVAHWQRVLHGDPTLDDDASTAEWMAEVWQAVRKRMNVHKWVHAAYQHVDGTSVAVACVTGVAAQMVQANPNLTPQQVREVICATALSLHHLPVEKRGAGLIQPAAAVAAALRATGGALAGLPQSGTLVRAGELHKRLGEVKVHLQAVVAGAGHAGPGPAAGNVQRVAYFGLHAPQADAVFLVGDFNGWRVGECPLERTARGWWQVALPLAPGDYAYRFWVDGAGGASGWRADPENQLRIESGYLDAHSRLIVD